MNSHMSKVGAMLLQQQQHQGQEQKNTPLDTWFYGSA